MNAGGVRSEWGMGKGWEGWREGEVGGMGGGGGREVGGGGKEEREVYDCAH